MLFIHRLKNWVFSTNSCDGLSVIGIISLSHFGNAFQTKTKMFLPSVLMSVHEYSKLYDPC